MLHGEGIKDADGIKIANQSGDLEMDRLSEWAQYNTKGPYK